MECREGQKIAIQHPRAKLLNDLTRTYTSRHGSQGFFLHFYKQTGEATELSKCYAVTFEYPWGDQFRCVPGEVGAIKEPFFIFGILNQSFIHFGFK